MTFRSDRPKTLQTPKTNINLKLRNGDILSITAYIVPRITETIDKRPFNIFQDEHTSYLFKDLPLPDNVPLENESSSVGLLVDNDYYLDIILRQKIDIQPELYLLASKFG